MKPQTVLAFARGGRLLALRAVTVVMTAYTRADFVVSAAREGVLAALGQRPRSVSELARELRLPAGAEAELEAWLEVGAALGELRCAGREWSLAGRLARALARPANDDALAMLEELTTLHRDLVHRALPLLRSGERLSLADQSGEVVARSSRMLEPLVQEAVSADVPERGPLRVLEVGCGSGTYVRYMLERNREARVHALELQPAVLAQARQNLEAWGVADRVTLGEGDVRAFQSSDRFDLVTLHNNIYYFAVPERVALLRHVRGLLAPGGRVLLTTPCRGGSASGAVLSLWGALTAGCGPLPRPEELVAQLTEAGFADARAESLAGPLERYCAFRGRAAG
ncbi:MAG: class I SAM-dependent methyltransferase [Polyangiaceae bacterium]|nr:class I SAM-dependent methyltransferase [Polyangiaceae bacterium]